MKRNIRRGFTLMELMVVIGILGLLMGILAVAVMPRWLSVQRDAQLIQMKDIVDGMKMISLDQRKQRRLRSAPLNDAAGREFYQYAFRAGVLEPELLPKIVTTVKGDFPVDRDWLDGDAELLETNCSYTAPRGQELIPLLMSGGRGERKVILTFNARNWANYISHGVPVFWNEGETGEYIEHYDVTQYNIDRETWENRPEDIIGKRAPFDKTFD